MGFVSGLWVSLVSLGLGSLSGFLGLGFGVSFMIESIVDCTCLITGSPIEERRLQ